MSRQKNALVFCGPRDPLWRERERRIQEAAYYKALQRYLAPGHELDDWLAAEQEVDDASRRCAQG